MALSIKNAEVERLAALGQLTGTVSHELRNPLGAMRTSIAVTSSVKVKVTCVASPAWSTSVARELILLV